MSFLTGLPGAERIEGPIAEIASRSPGWASAAAGAPSFERSTGGGGSRFALFFGSRRVGSDQRNVHEMLGEEPHLEFIGADDVADQQIIGTVIAGVNSLFGHGTRFL